MPKLNLQTMGRFALAGLAAIAAAGLLYVVTRSALGFPSDGIRIAALNIASLVVAFLLIAGIGRRPKDER
ncbi:hypothetical protein LPW26_09760 [Rhodopseudomonas sp. HC1]|uniref:hypothetical protein n=1 Tax=Rhodopseudomonas infernalis TaxID=2897386 RepID=UPI001EE805CF|nr:hypothetical protein [Rhodopseudomonas infernalis]MCG6204923.1 hypothetical protein [Rhodopseudomonas infernalis]